MFAAFFISNDEEWIFLISINNKVPKLFIIAGCNGAGKTTASYTILPELLNIKEFVNADEIARGLSPFQPETVSLEAGRIMLKRIDELISQRIDFAFETTLSTRSFMGLCRSAREKGYTVHLVFLWLDNSKMAIQRVKQRVSEGGHHVPEYTIVRRYKRGLSNFHNLYKGLVDDWLFFDNSEEDQELLAIGNLNGRLFVHDQHRWQKTVQYD
jgi:predicted ABC-type ATPase